MNKHLGKLDCLNWTSKFHLATWGMIPVRSTAGLLAGEGKFEVPARVGKSKIQFTFMDESPIRLYYHEISILLLSKK